MKVKITDSRLIIPTETLVGEKVEIIDEENEHVFIFTQKEDKGVQLEIKPYGGKLG